MAVTTAYQPTPLHYPVHVDAQPEAHASRWLWLVKWLLAIPHYVVLAFLWTAFVVLSAAALVAILVTGRYPRAIFDFNVGVLRWTWRVAYYSYGALGTDRYPPFTLGEDHDFPAHLSVEYPEQLSRGLALVKWWLLAIPQYIVVGLFLGTGAWAAQDVDGDRLVWGGGLVGILVLVAAVVLTVTGVYPRPVYDLLLGLNRWVLRVAAYAGLMTDQYPPFRLDQGPHDPDSALVVRAPSAGPGSATATVSAGHRASVAGAERQTRWTTGPVLSVVAGSLVALLSLGLLAGGTAVLVADGAGRDADGYVSWGSELVTSQGYAVVVDDVLITTPGDPGLPARLVGDVRVTVSSLDAATPVFVGIGPDRAVDSYLDGVAYTVPGDGNRSAREVSGSAPVTPPAQLGVWAAQATGSGPQDLTWTPRDGRWAAVVMNADGTRPVAADVRIAATLPWLGGLGVALLAGGLIAAAVAAVVIGLAVRVASRDRTS